MATHPHPEIEAQILDLSKATTSEIGASEERLRADIYKIKDELKSDIAGLSGRMDSQSGRMDSLEGKLNDVQEDIKAIRDFLIPPNS